MTKVNFCYQISEDAKMAVTDDGENAKAYIKASIDSEKPFTDEEFKRLHEVIMRRNIASQLGIDGSLITPISYEKYLQDADDE